MAKRPPGEEVLAVYPELAQALDALCERPPWRITGVSAILFDDEYGYFEVAKPKHWRRCADDAFLVGIGGIGGSIEEGETALGCLAREAQEEIGLALDIFSACEVHFVYEEKWRASLYLERRTLPLPALFTVSANLYRQQEFAAWPTLAIISFLARPVGQPTLGDLFGLLAVPRKSLKAFLTPDEVPWQEALRLPGLQAVTASPLPPKTILVPTWTVRSLQCLLRAGIAIC